MNVTSLDLCKELYELSGWIHVNFAWSTENPHYAEFRVRAALNTLDDAPAYDLGYLLRKLPAQIDFNDEIVKLTVDRQSEKTWRASYAYPVERVKSKRKYADWKFTAYQANTPEDAACKLAIELFKQNILTRDKE